MDINGQPVAMEERYHSSLETENSVSAPIRTKTDRWLVFDSSKRFGNS